MSVSRSLTPYLILGVLALGVGLGATLGVSSAPRYTYFAEPSPGHPQVVSAFRKLVRHTLAYRSFTVDYNGFTLIYQAPDRTEFRVEWTCTGWAFDNRHWPYHVYSARRLEWRSRTVE